MHSAEYLGSWSDPGPERYGGSRHVEDQIQKRNGLHKDRCRTWPKLDPSIEVLVGMIIRDSNEPG